MNYDLTINTNSDYTKAFTIKQNDVPMNLTGYAAYFTVIKSPWEASTVVFSTTGGQIANGGVDGTLTLSLTVAEIATIDGTFYKIEIESGGERTEVLSGNLFLLSNADNSAEYLIPVLRLHLGDTDPLNYRYMDEWLEVALVSAIKALMRWWGPRYLVDEVNNISRNADVTFDFDAPPIIQQQDERPIILMAAILVKSGQLENNSWQVGSWRDAEIAVSNIEGSRSKQFGMNLDWQELQMYLTPATKRLFGGVRTDLPSDYLWTN